MNIYALGALAAMIGAVVLATMLGLRYSHAALLFGIVALIAAPIVIHKIERSSWSFAFLMVLAIFASFPLKKLFQMDDFLYESALTLGYLAALWTVGFGWRRSWQSKPNEAKSD